MSVWSDAFTELVREVQPDLDPTLTKGDGVSPSPAMELDAILLSTLRGVAWTTATALTYGRLVFPTSAMGRVYKVVEAGTTGATEPVWTNSDYDYARVTDGTVTYEEAGSDTELYDLQRAKYKAMDLKVQKSVNRDQYIQDARGQANTFLYLNLVRERDKFQVFELA